MERTETHDLTAGYALDALDEPDERLYEEHLRSCERCREELASFAEVTAQLAHAVAGPPPPPALRERLLEEVRSERKTVVPLRSRWTVPAAATLAAVAACAALGLGLWATSLSRSLDRERSARGDDTQLLTILADPTAQRTSLSGKRGSLVVADDGGAALVVSGLGRLGPAETYEAWVAAGGKPRRAGTFRGGGTRVAFRLRQPVPSGALVMVTVEPSPGLDAPSGKPILRGKAA